MIDESEILRQREIGKQLMVDNILKCENKGSISFISIDDLAKWASYTKEKMRDFYSLLGYDWDVIKVLLELNVSYDDYMEFIERLKLSFVI